MSETNEGFPEAVDTTVVADQAASTAEVPQTEPTETTEQADPPTTETQPQTEDAPKRRPWWEKRIAETAFEAREAKRERDAALTELARAKTAQPTTTPTPANVVPAAEVETRAAQLVQERMFMDACNEIADAGAAKHADFDDAVRNFAMLGEMPKSFLEAVTALGKDDGSKVYYDLGKNPDEAARIFGLPPVKMAMELAKMAAATPKLAAVSKAPAPIEPITATAVRVGAEPDPVKDSVAWTAWFNAERRKR